MTKTLLNGVNDVLKRTGVIKGNSGDLVSLEDTQRQVNIDLAVQAWNETILELFDLSDTPMPNEMATQAITLVTNDRDYTLNSNVVTIRWPLRNDTTGFQVQHYPNGWEGIQEDQYLPNNYTGKPSFACIRPDGLLYFDKIPTSAENGLTLTMYYDKSIIMSVFTDVFPFNDTVYQYLISAVTEKIKMGRDEQSEARYKISLSKYNSMLGQAARKLSMLPRLNYWTPYRTPYEYGASGGSSSDPLSSPSGQFDNSFDNSFG